MYPAMMIPFAMIASAKKEKRSRLAQAMLPSMVPLPAGPAAAFAAINATSQIAAEDKKLARLKAEELDAHQRLLTESVKAVEIAIGTAKGTLLTAADIDALPTFKAALAIRPELKKLIVA